MTVTKDLYVTIDYTFTDPDGNVLGSSATSGPYTFCQGRGDTLPGLESRLEGSSLGAALEFVIPPEEAYGPRDEQLVRNLERSSLHLGRDPEVGMRVNAGNTVAYVTAITDDHVVVDANHPLAGIPLHFSVTVTGVDTEDPTPPHACSCGGSCNC